MLLEEIESELGESELGILGKCIDTECLPYILFAVLPFLSLLLFVVFFSVKS